MTLPAGYDLRARRMDDDPRLVAIENAANRLFATAGYPQLAEDGFADAAEFRRMIGDGQAIVAVDAADVPAGYAVVLPLGTYAHLRELAVDPLHGRKGLSGALVGAVLAAARKAGHAGVSLSTFRAVPFNRPFYERLGFAELSPAAAPSALAAAFRDEVPAGIDPAERLLMVHPLR